ncbi:MAG: DNA polymerase III subunit beta [Eubacteriaceae bacterium]|nr:DNA polymerase III subunit beta [Eubacteriaceae bacterium]
MKISAPSKDLLKAANSVSRSVPTKTTNPILSCVHIQARNGRLTLSGTDGELAAISSMPAEVIAEGEALIQMRTMADLLRTYSEESTVEISCDESSVVRFATPSSDVKIQGRSVSEYPLPELAALTSSVALDAEMLSRMIRETVFAASKLEGSSQSPSAMTGELVEIDSGMLRIVALNGFLMAIRQEALAIDSEMKCVVPARALSELVRLLSQEEGEVHIEIGRSRFIASFGDTQLQSSLLSGEFINYSSIIPKDANTIIKASVPELLESLERASLMSDEKSVSVAYFKASGTVLQIRSENSDGSVSDELSVQLGGEEIEIAFNSKFLIEILKAVPDERIVMEFSNPQSPGLIKPVGSENYLYLIMPVRL